MVISTCWFVGILLVSLGALWWGRRLGRQGRTVVHLSLAASMALVALAAVPKFRPWLLHLALPLDISIWIEGVIAVVPWMLLVGVLWTADLQGSPHRIAPLTFLLGLVYYLFGGIWMLLAPINVEGRDKISEGGVTLQSRPDTCTPSASATALRYMGIDSSEGEMCAVVLAKPGRGSTLGRAAWGLGRYLEPHGYDVSLEALNATEAAEIARPDQPLLVTIRSQLVADHMVVLLGNDQDGVLIANPSPGIHGGVSPLESRHAYGLELYRPEDFARLYRGAAIVFNRDGRGRGGG